MPHVTFQMSSEDFVATTDRGSLLRAEKANSFDASILDLGDIRKRSTSIEVLAAVFDLQGFTTFCTEQRDPQLTVPLFLSPFLDWLLKCLRDRTCTQDEPGLVALKGPLPFFVKFMGDGVLLLWSLTPVTGHPFLADIAVANLIDISRAVCMDYRSDFSPHIAKFVQNCPPILRCGIAKGLALSIGEGDYIGSCINVAARMQKLPGATFAYSRYGIVLPNEVMERFGRTYVDKEVDVRGINQRERVGIIASEFDSMTDEEKSHYY